MVHKNMLKTVKKSISYRTWQSLVAPLFLAGIMVFFIVQKSAAGPITNPGAAPYAKLSVYQGVISVVPGGAGDSVMEIGNAGRDIASTGNINLRAGGGSVILPAAIVQALNQPGNAQTFGASSAGSIGAGSFAFLTPYVLANGGYNDVTRANDAGLFFSQNIGLTIGGWNNSGAVKGLRVAGQNAAAAALAVNNGLAGQGSAGDGIAVFATSASGVAPNYGSALYAEQRGGTASYAGYFTSGSAGQLTDTLSYPYGTLFADNLLQDVSTGTVVNANAGSFIGDLEVRQKGTSVPSPGWPRGAVLKVLGDAAYPAPGGFVLDVRNLGASGYAASFIGRVLFSNATEHMGGAEVRGSLTHTGGISFATGTSVLSTAVAAAGTACTTPCSNSGLTCIYAVNITTPAIAACATAAPAGGANCICK
jgi:hypothetical protein